MPRLESFSKKDLPSEIEIAGDYSVYIPKYLKEKGVVLGAGGSRFVIPNPENPGKEALAFIYSHDFKPLHAKQIYYSQKVLNTLFPHNFPKIYTTTAGSFADEQELPVEIRQRVKGEFIADNTKLFNTPKNKMLYIFDSLHKFLQKKQHIRYPYFKVMSFLKELGLREYDGDNEKNFINGDDGGQYFVDVLFEAGVNNNKDILGLLNLDPRKLETYMNKNKYPEVDIRIALGALKRLQFLSKESEEMSNKE